MSQNSLPTVKKKRSMLVPLLVVFAVAACGAAGYYWWIVQQHKTQQEQLTKAKLPPEPVFMNLEPFTVSLLSSNNNIDRVLYIGLTLRLPDLDTRRELHKFLPEVRSRLLVLFSRQDPVHLASDQGKQQLVEQIKNVLGPPLIKDDNPQVISDVLFTAFVLR